MRPYTLVSASVSAFCHFLFLSANHRRQLILLTPTHLTKTDLSSSLRKFHQVTGNTFQCFYSAVTNFVELNRQEFCAVCNYCRLEHFNFVLPTVLHFP
jgi:hypothetical protein